MSITEPVRHNKNFIKMISGEQYNCLDSELLHFWQQQQAYNHQLNIAGNTDSLLLPNVSDNAIIKSPFFISYGINLYLAKGVFINANVTLQDNAPITVGAQTMIGPNVQFYTASHPLNAAQRCQGIETALAIHVGERVWIGGGAIILPGVSIGDEAVVGAGAVVTKDVAARTLVVGNPAKMIKAL
ncbi:maltose O-acetyltransferase [Shewanella colwelliana]|uniref:sugar O-acetyltransferase n=1 Tax=Shewanella colwelliana TaxID=23 RepID=UPI001BB8703F|nr:sugar O-acetyltransferase [Shewanella colwelliana]GIU18505.1 maltose O-acetyltransferase [Shewanella colwelliana]